VAELSRGKAGRLIGDLTGFLATLKGLPLAYNRDLQEDKEPLFDALGTLSLSLVALRGLFETLDFLPERMQAAADVATSAATDLAEHLVREGMPFREAHAAVGSLVRDAADAGRPFEEVVAADGRFGPDVRRLFEPGETVRRRTTPGGAGPEPVREQLAAARARLAGQALWLHV